ncbi:hypothetical protein FB45DRAFT_1105490 [Roridomyces roridus]|uniref:phytol kinase n=1 Tax=Roridomyces roridus TaxID=1738132 RepID=A0AAD7BBF5_9AGAR|nr:hypothetical protein FB45DRAFT_1105490 [Roridomyces roridus]
MPPHLVYRSFVDPLLTKPGVNDAFGNLFAALLKREPALAQYEQIEEEVSSGMCGNIQCQRLDRKQNFKKCAKCQVVMYCSRECQRDDWNALHRDECSEMNSRQFSRAPRRPKTDSASVLVYSQWLAGGNHAIFRTIAERDFPGVPHEELLPCVDMTLTCDRQLIAKVSATPSRFITTARHHSPHGYAVLWDLHAVWPNIPDTIELGVVEMFLSHLQVDKVPPPNRAWQIDADFANVSLDGLRYMTSLLDTPSFLQHARAVLAGLPGILGWSLNLHPEDVKSAYNHRCYERVIQASGGDTTFIAQLVLGQVKKATKDLDKPSRRTAAAFALSGHIRLLTVLCEPYPHSLPTACFKAGATRLVTSAFIALSTITPNPAPTERDALATLLDFFGYFLECEDYPPLLRAVKAGFLTALLDCSPALPDLPQSSVDTALNLVGKVMPPYLVYRSFAMAVKRSELEIRENWFRYGPLLAKPGINEAFGSLLAALRKREPALEQYEQQDESLRMCANIQCQRLDSKHNFKKCAKCQGVLYCSRECQRTDWNALHRDECSETKLEQLKPTHHHPKTNIGSILAYAQWLASKNYSVLRAIAGRDFAGVPHEELVPCVDMTSSPEVFSIRRIQELADNPVVEPAGFPGLTSRLDPVRLQELMEQYKVMGLTPMQGLITPGAKSDACCSDMPRSHVSTHVATHDLKVQGQSHTKC